MTSNFTFPTPAELRAAAANGRKLGRNISLEQGPVFAPFALIHPLMACAVARRAIEVTPMGTMPVSLPAEMVAALIRAAEDAEATKNLVCSITAQDAAKWEKYVNVPMAIAATIHLKDREIQRLRDGSKAVVDHGLDALIKERDALHARLDAFDNWMASDDFRAKETAERGLCTFQAKAMETQLYYLNARINHAETMSDLGVTA